MSTDTVRRVVLETRTTLPDHLTFETVARIDNKTGEVFLDWTCTDRHGHDQGAITGALTRRSLANLLIALAERGITEV